MVERHYQIGKGIWLGLCLFMASAAPALGQVATPSLDPSLPSLTGATTSWRYGSTLGGESVIGSYQSSGNEVAAKSLQNNYTLAFQTTQLTLEANGTQGGINTLWEGGNDRYYEWQESDSHVLLAVRGENRVSVGVSLNTSKTTLANVIRKEKSYGGGLGLRLGEGFYLAGAMEKVSEEVLGFDDKKWTRNLAGAGFRYGWPDGNQFRTEYALISNGGSPQGQVWAEVVPTSQTTIGTLEFTLGGFLFSLENTKIIQEPVLNWGENRVQNWNRYGLGLKSLNYSLIFYRRAGVETQGTAEQQMNHYHLTFGFHFI